MIGQSFHGAPDNADELLALLESALDASDEGILVTNAHGRIVYYNRTLSKLEGLRREDVLGRHLTEVYQVTPEGSEHLTVVETGEPIRDLAKIHFTSDGRAINLVASTYPVFKGRRVIGACSICRDVTQIKDLVKENINLQKQMQVDGCEKSRVNGTRYTFKNFLHASPAMDRLVCQAEKAAKSDCAVMVYGETGTGKEVVVQSIHNASARRNELFVGLNCAAIPDALLESLLFGTAKGAFTGALDSPGLIAHAGKGTLFLDEINAMSLTLQAKLLRVLQERTYNRLGANKELPLSCRIIGSTNLDPWECIRMGTLRKDIYYRFAVFTIYMPPLRERPEDIEALSTYFINRYGKVYGQRDIQLDAGLKEAFLSYQWPGNVRELEHIIESSVAMLDPGESIVTCEHLPSYVRPKFTRKNAQFRRLDSQATLHEIMKDAERQVIIEALRINQGNISKSARSLGILRQNLQYRMRRLGLSNGTGSDGNSDIPNA
jgi:arginine utilization regulatory protein